MKKEIIGVLGNVLLVSCSALSYNPPLPEAPIFEPIPIEETITTTTSEELPQEQPILDEYHPVNEFTYDEAQELLKIAYSEAGNQGENGQWLVMSVVINRVNDPDWPDSIHEVIHQSGQFHVKGMSVAEPTSDTHYALYRIESGEVARGIIAFEKVGNNALDEYFEEVFEVKDHKFYVKK